MRRGSESVLWWCGLTGIVVSVALIALIFACALFHRPVPGDEGGCSYLFFLSAYATLPPSLAILALAALVNRRRQASRQIVLYSLSVLFAALVWLTVRTFLGSIRAGWWPDLLGALALLAALLPGPFGGRWSKSASP